MRGWSRREVLAALAAAGAAPAWAGLVSGCSASGGVAARRGATAAPRDAADLRAQLRQVLAELSPRFREVRGRAEIARSTRVVVDATERGVWERWASGVVLAGRDATGWIELGSQDVSPDGVRALAVALAARGATADGGTGASATAAAAKAFAPPLRVDPRRTARADWLARATKLYERAGARGGSRIVYRTAAVVVDDRDLIVIADGTDVASRQVATRGSVLFLAWTGTRMAAEEAARAASAGLESSEVTDDDLGAAADGALAHLADSAPAAGEHELVLDPSVTALLLRHGVAPAMTGDAWVTLAAPAVAAGTTLVTIRADPTAAAAYGAYRVDDEGAPGAAVALIDRGAIGAPMTDRATAATLAAARNGHGRRGAPLAAARPRPSHLVLEPGAETRDALIAGVKQGFLIESGAGGGGDPAAWRVGLRARRAREIAGGRLTGRAYGPVQITGGVADMLAAVRAVGSVAAAASWRETDGDPDAATAVPVSASAPHIATRGWMGGVR